MKERKQDRTCTPVEGAEGEERFPHSGKPSHWQGDHLGQRQSFRDSEESAATGLWQDRVRPIQAVHATTLRAPA